MTGRRPDRRCVAALAVLGAPVLVAALAGAGRAQEPDAPKPAAQPPPRAFQAILWLHGGPARDAAFFAAVRAAGYDAVSVSGGQAPELPGAHGLRFYHDQIVGKGILELRDGQYAPVAAEYARTREPECLRRPGCLAETGTLLQMVDILAERLPKTLPQRPLAISLGDEISLTSHANPLDFCFAPATLRAFRMFLRARYGTIERLNATWRTDFSDFDRVVPATADEIRRRELNGSDYPAALGPWADHREFMDRELARTVRSLVRQVGRAAADLPCGLTGIQQPSAYGGHDYARLLPLCSFYEVYDIGGARDLAMSLAPAGAWQMATLFPPKAGAANAPVVAQLADLVAHGMRGVIVWSAGLAFDEARRPTAYGAAITKALGELRGVAEAFAGAELRRGPVWIVESQPSVRAWWMLDSRGDGATWIKRLSSYEMTHSTSLAARHGWVRLLEDLGLQPRLVPAGRLAAQLQRQPPRLLVLPATIAMADATAAAVRRFVAAGGTVVADHTPGLFDERLALRARPALDDLFAVRGRRLRLGDLLVDQGRPRAAGRLPSGAAAAERRIGSLVSEPVGGFQVQLEHATERGRAFYLNMAVCEYGRVRLRPEALAAALDLRKRVRFVLRQAGVQPPVYLRAEGMPTCLERMLLTARDGRELLAIRVNALEAPAILQRLIARGPVRLVLAFAEPTGLVDLRSGAERAPALRHEVTLDPARGLFFEVRRGG